MNAYDQETEDMVVRLLEWQFGHAYFWQLNQRWKQHQYRQTAKLLRLIQETRPLQEPNAPPLAS